MLASVLIGGSSASAHTGSAAGGFAAGLAHPVFGPDHVVAMVAVGLWGAFLGAPAIWLLPVVFPMVMALGGVVGIVGLPLPGVEIGIALSALVLGVMVLLAARPPMWVAAALVGCFAVFHGYAHGAELPPGADAVAYAAGFVVATGLLHIAGISFGLLARWPAGRFAVRAAGGAIALAGLAFLGGIRSGMLAGLLHPLAVPTHVLALLAVGLLAGQQGRIVLPQALFALGVAAGLVAIASAARQSFAADALVALAAAAGALVALSQPVPIAANLIAAVTGCALGLDSPPQAVSLSVAAQALVGTGLGACLVLIVVVACTRLLKRAWHGIVVRILGSWVAASAILVLALRFARAPGF